MEFAARISMPVWVYRCHACKADIEVAFPTVVERDAAEKQGLRCACNHTYFLQRIHAPANFAVKGYNAKNGYSGG